MQYWAFGTLSLGDSVQRSETGREGCLPGSGRERVACPENRVYDADEEGIYRRSHCDYDRMSRSLGVVIRREDMKIVKLV